MVVIPPNLRRPSVLLVGLAALLVLGHLAVVYAVDELILDHRLIISESRTEVSPLDISEGAEGPFAELGPSQPMVEIDPFDEEAQSWSTVSGLGHSGVTVFDANGDGWPDVYFCQDGLNWTRASDSDGVLLSDPRHQRNVLYLHRGLDAEGQPIYRRIDEVAKANNTFVREELLVENFFYPRQSADEGLDRAGRQGVVAVAADFNADGRLDLLVGNGLTGMLWSHPETQRVLQPFISPSGRQARRSRQPLAGLGLGLIEYQPRNNDDDRRVTERAEDEAEGANSLFLNLGDRDGDGLPEWRDASREAGIEGKRHTVSLGVADIDLDGDLDLFEGNVMDFDYWPGGSKSWAGGANQLYVNQLAETGRLVFEERAAAMDVDGVFDEDNPMVPHYRLRRIPFLPPHYSILFFDIEPFERDILSLNGQSGEPGQISWASVFQDVDDDGYPDLWVANDFSRLELYRNEEGKRFRKIENARSGNIGSWMALAPADFDRDLAEDVFAGNTGGGGYSHGFVTPDLLSMLDPVVAEGAYFSQLINGHFDARHLILDGRDPRRALDHRVRHSAVLPPDTSLPGNTRTTQAMVTDFRPEFDRNTLDPYEFTWGATSFDLQNDGRPDLYFVGTLYGRGGGLFGVVGTGPGRLLVNATADSSALRFVDLTAEHRLFNIHDLRYDRVDEEGYLYRPAPRQNWDKRDVVHSFDRSVWTSQGRAVQERISNSDLVQTAEAGQTVVAADLDRDGFDDLLLRNAGGYDSRSPTAGNLKARLDDGMIAAVPPPDPNYPVLTEYEPGSTRVFLNRYRDNHWLAVRLLDEEGLNRDAIGARLVINDTLLAVHRINQGSHIGNVTQEPRFGLGQDRARSLRVVWPDRQRTESTFELPDLADGLLTVSKQRGILAFEPLVPESIP